MNDRELLELIASQVGALTSKVGTISTDLQEVKGEVKSMKDKVTVIEQDHGKKLDLLFDGYKQNSDKLDRIEEEVSKHEEIILRRIK